MRSLKATISTVALAALAGCGGYTASGPNMGGGAMGDMASAAAGVVVAAALSGR
jgi:hypothetical protein